MRRLFGPRGTAERNDTLFAADADPVSEEDGDHAAWVAERKANRGKRRKSVVRIPGRRGILKVERMVAP